MSKIIGLIGGASGKELTERLHDKGYRVALIVGRNGEMGTEQADYLLTTDLRNVRTINSFLNDLGVKYLLVGTGHRFAFELAEKLEQYGLVPNINTSSSKLAKEKRLFKDYISKKGILTPEYISINSLDDIVNIDETIKKIGIPCVVKATIDTMLPQKANSREELIEGIQEILASGSPVIVEQFVRGIDCTVFVSVKDKIVKALPICYYSKAEDNDMKGFSSKEYSKMTLSQESEDRVKRYIVEECGFEGLPRVDLMALPDGTAYILEVNSVGVTGICERHAPYCLGTVLALRAKGIDVAEIVVNNALAKWNLR